MNLRETQTEIHSFFSFHKQLATFDHNEVCSSLESTSATEKNSMW